MGNNKRLYNVLLDSSYDCLARLGGGRIDASAWDLSITFNEVNLGGLLEIWYDNVLWVRTERASAVVLGELDTVHGNLTISTNHSSASCFGGSR